MQAESQLNSLIELGYHWHCGSCPLPIRGNSNGKYDPKGIHPRFIITRN